MESQDQAQTIFWPGKDGAVEDKLVVTANLTQCRGFPLHPVTEEQNKKADPQERLSGEPREREGERERERGGKDRRQPSGCYFMLVSHRDRKANLVFSLGSFEEGLPGGSVYLQAGIDLMDAHRSPFSEIFTGNDCVTILSTRPSSGLLADDCSSRNLAKVLSLVFPCYWFSMD